ncbi:MAG TPA: adenylate/guanylate cyclase domain-containing protein, partial [Acidimicrobiales bacterium]|nr:adenylate/guanylate cyclase domain-containing protein [Acidimicrobiales bacterium]
MGTCGTCGAANPASSRFCGSCGTPLLGLACPSCAALNPEGQRFCGQCGTALGGAPVPTSTPVVLEERKLATVLFADVVGFTSLAERTDAEAVARTVDAAFRRLGDVVAEHGGTVDKYMGDSLLALFGVPTAHDDDAERAVAAGLAMREVGGDLAFSIGINTGEVMVTSLVDGRSTVIGDAVNVAARLEKAAGPGQVLVGELTARLAGRRVAFDEGRPLVVKGKREPVMVYAAVGVRAGGHEHEDDPGRPPLVGRDADQAFLQAQWDRAVADRRPAMVLVVGEPGVGTTRLVEELCSRVSPCANVASAAYPAYGALGGPRVAADLARQLGPLGDPEVDLRVRSAAGDLDPSLRSIDPTTIRSEQVWAFRRLFEAKAADRPLLVVLDDAHRAGDKTLELIDEVVQHLDDVPALVVLVGRPSPSAWLERFPAATTLRVGPLGRSDAATLARALVPDPPLTDEATALLVERSSGNALYLRELVALARERGDLVVEGGRTRLASPSTVPPSLRALLAARLDSLEPEQKLAVQHVAVLGPATVEQVEALGLDGAAAAIRPLVVGHLLRRVAGERYDVADPLLGEVAYETLPREVRADRHQRAAAAATSTEERARHLVRAASYVPDREDVRQEAAETAAAAGRELLADLRHFDAVRLLQQAVDLGHRDPDVLLSLAETVGPLGRPDDVLRVLDMLPERLDDPAVEARRVHVRAAAALFTDPAWAADTLEDAAARWEAVGNRSKLGWARSNRGVALFNLSQMEAASAELHRAREIFMAAGDREGQHAAQGFLALIHPTDPRVRSWLEEAAQAAEEAGDRSRQVGIQVSLAWHLTFRSRGGGPDEIAEAHASAMRLAELARDIRSPDFQVHGAALAADLARLAGLHDDAAEAAEWLRGVGSAGATPTGLAEAGLFVVDVCAPGGERLAAPETIQSTDPVASAAATMVTEALALAGRIDEAVARVERWQGGPGAAAARFGTLGAFATPSVSFVLVLAGRLDEARFWLEAGVEASRAMGDRSGTAIVRGLLAEATLRSGGSVDEARRWVEGVEDPGGVAGAILLRARA